MNTEEKILEAAKLVFIKQGFDGTSMQQIADEAGINKALLHYYFRSKQKLFDAVFQSALKGFVPLAFSKVAAGGDLESNLCEFAYSYIDLVSNNPHIPAFVLMELNRDPGKLCRLLMESGIKPEFLLSVLRQAIEKGDLVSSSPQHFITNLIGLCIFPFIAKPLIFPIFFNENSEEWAKYLSERKSEIKRFISNSFSK